jgi:beta-1,4-mannooligosaccharide/beta-1,4-mannosyl-N-acetylglucosamine phosphorylase
MPEPKGANETMTTIPGYDLRKIRDDFRTAPFVKRYEGNPVLTPEQVPYPSTNTHNCGVTRFGDGYVMLFRNDHWESIEPLRGCTSTAGIADSKDGIHWTVRSEATPVRGNDPRITRIGDTYYICTAAHAIWQTTDFETFSEVCKSFPNSRNQSLFPEKIDGTYWRLERPTWQSMMPYVNQGRLPQGWIGTSWDILIQRSPDLIHWGAPATLLRCGDVEYANCKIGGGAPPIRTEEGWLCFIHGDDIDPRRGKNGWEDNWFGRYHVGLMLLDLEDPTKVIAYSKVPLMTPETELEVNGGYRNNVIFVTSALLDGDTITIYYGASDTYVCMATMPLRETLDFCRNA